MLDQLIVFLPASSTAGAVTVAHLVLLGLWGGVVAAEAVLELYPVKHPAFARHTAVVHYWIDLLVELPLIVGVALSGVILAALRWPLTSWHWVKLVAAAGAIVANLTCIVLVIRRYRRRDDQSDGDDVMSPGTRQIFRSAILGMPCAAVAVALGFWLAAQRW